MSDSSDRLRASLRKLAPAKPTDAPAPQRPQHNARDWQQYIETELDQMNRRLAAIENRMTVIFYLVIIVSVVMIVTDASAATKLLQGVLQMKP